MASKSIVHHGSSSNWMCHTQPSLRTRVRVIERSDTLGYAFCFPANCIRNSLSVCPEQAHDFRDRLCQYGSTATMTLGFMSCSRRAASIPDLLPWWWVPCPWSVCIVCFGVWLLLTNSWQTVWPCASVAAWEPWSLAACMFSSAKLSAYKWSLARTWLYCWYRAEARLDNMPCNRLHSMSTSPVSFADMCLELSVQPFHQGCACHAVFNSLFIKEKKDCQF